jgi:hypothetical protein
MKGLVEVEKRRAVVFRKFCGRTIYADNNGLFAFYDLAPGKYLVLVEGAIKDRMTIWSGGADLKGSDEAAFDFGDSNVGGTERIYAFADRPQSAAPAAVSAADQNNMGVKYLNGEGVPKDPKEAAKWFLLAAKNGSPHAQCTLGVMFHEGMGVDQDDAKALELLRLSAEQQFAQAEVNLGLAYYNGWGVQRDIGKAVQWMRRAAAHGDEKAGVTANNIVLEDSKERGVLKNPPDRDAAEQYISVVADTIVQAKIRSGELMSARRIGVQFQYIPRSAESCDANIQVDYAFTFRTRAGVTRTHNGFLFFYHDPRRHDWFNSQTDIDGSPTY